MKKKNAQESFLGFRCRKTVLSESPVVFKNSGCGFSKKMELVGAVGSWAPGHFMNEPLFQTW